MSVDNQDAAATLDARTNWWDEIDQADVLAKIGGAGTTLSNPWITAFTDDPGKASDPGFWPVPYPENDSLPTVLGDCTVGEVLTADEGTWTGLTGASRTSGRSPTPEPSGWTDIAVTTNSTYVPPRAEYDKYLRVLVTGNNPDGG